MLSIKHADAAVARSLPSREGGPFDGCRPLHSLLRHRVRALQSLADCGAASFWWSLPNLAPKLALEKATLVEERSDALIFGTSDGAVRVLPLADRAAYWQTLMGLVEAKKTIALVPEWAANALRKHYRVTPQQKEFVVATATLRELPGGRLRNQRNLINQCRRATTVGRFEGDHVEDYLAVNKAWYRQNAEAKFRTYDKTSIDWLLQNWTALRAAAPDLLCLGARGNADARLIAFTVASKLCTGVWSAYTERFDREHPIQGCNWMLWQDFARLHDEPFENDGTADTTALRHNKGKVVASLTPFFRLEP